MWTLGLWGFLIVLFVALYRIFSMPGGPEGESPAPPAAHGASAFLVVQVLLAVVFVVFVAFAIIVIRARGVNELSFEGVALVNQGRYSAALEKFEALRRKQPASLQAGYNVAVVRLALWQPAEAAELLERVAGDTRKVINLTGPQTDVRALARPALALAKALVGRTTEADTWLEACRASGEADQATATLAAAAQACRNAKWEDARTLLVRNEVHQLGGFHRALAEALLSWATEQKGGTAIPLNKVAFYGETGPEQVRTVWPELVDFVERAPAV